MSSPHKFYMEHMHSKTGYRAAWDPGRPLKIGQIGKLDPSGFFMVYSNLEKEGILPEVLLDDSDGDMDFNSSETLQMSVKLGGTAPAAGSILTQADAGFSFEFKSEKSVVFQTAGNKTHQIVNMAEIERKILEKYKNGIWEKDWLVVTQLVEAASSTIIIANSRNSSLELKAKAGVNAGQLKLTDVSLGLTVASEKGSTYKYITQENLTPLYRVMGIRHPLFGKPQLSNRSDKEALTRETFSLQDFDAGELNND